MEPGSVVLVTSGKHKNKNARVLGSDGWFFTVRLLTPSGLPSRAKDDIVTLHKAHITLNG